MQANKMHSLRSRLVDVALLYNLEALLSVFTDLHCLWYDCD